MNLSDARQFVMTLVQDEATKLTIPDDFDLALKKALSHYSQFRPRVLSQTVTVGANGEVATSAITSFDQGFLDQMEVEFPILTGAGRQTWLDDYELSQSDAGQVIRFCYVIPASGDSVRVVHRVKHVLPTDDAVELTVRESDTEAVCEWAASEALKMLARLFTQTVSKSPQVDLADFSNKGQDYESRARTHQRAFYDHLHAAGRREGSSVMLVRG